MKFDTIIIGGGLAGLTCGLRLSRAGKKTAILSGGLNSLSFASGSIDLLGFLPDGGIVDEPFAAIQELITERKDHPYAKAGMKTLRNALDFFAEETSSAGLELFRDGERNHFKVTPLGSLRPGFLSQRSVWHDRIAEGFCTAKSIAILGFEGYRDFHPAVTAANLRRLPLLDGIRIESGVISLPSNEERNPLEYRSIDIARAFENSGHRRVIAEAICNAAPDAQMAGLPAFIGIWDSARIYDELCDLTQKIIFEIPSLPPSLPGMRLDSALKTRYAGLGMYMAGDRAATGVIENGEARFAVTESNEGVHLEADSFVLATGSFLGGGLVSSFDEGISEPLFGLSVDANRERSRWYAPRFFAKEGHPFLTYGVATDKALRAKDGSGKTVKNLFCAGAVLSGFDPIREGSGGGVAITSGFAAAERILKG